MVHSTKATMNGAIDQSASMIPIFSPESLEALKANMTETYIHTCTNAPPMHTQKELQQNLLSQVISKFF